AMRYLAHYPEELQAQVRRLIDSDKLGEFLLEKYPCAHTRSTDRAQGYFSSRNSPSLSLSIRRRT
ncbi:MAG: hypothetical protein P8Y65_06940, partial [Campylobacterales bacterium]